MRHKHYLRLAAAVRSGPPLTRIASPPTPRSVAPAAAQSLCASAPGRRRNIRSEPTQPAADDRSPDASPPASPASASASSYAAAVSGGGGLLPQPASSAVCPPNSSSTARPPSCSACSDTSAPAQPAALSFDAASLFVPAAIALPSGVRWGVRLLCVRLL